MDKRLYIVVGSVALLFSVLVVSLFIYQVFIAGKPSTNVARLSVNEKISLVSSAKTLKAQGKDEDAIRILSGLIAKYPVSPEAEEAFFEIGSIYEKRGELFKARDIYRTLLERYPGSGNIAKADEALGRVNIRVLFSPLITEDSIEYEIKEKDTLTKIARRFNTTVELISRANGLKDANIKFGKKLKITKAKFSIVVDKSQNILSLISDGKIAKTYRVSTGMNNATPVGSFTITTKIVNPVWYTTGAVVPAGSPKNILGTRWMGISQEGYGIHGTTEPQSIGKSVTAGCVRMPNADVEELYTIVPQGTEVTIMD